MQYTAYVHDEQVPVGILKLFRGAFDWIYESEKEEHTDNRGIYLARGKVSVTTRIWLCILVYFMRIIAYCYGPVEAICQALYIINYSAIRIVRRKHL
jgi:hypothetical protein